MVSQTLPITGKGEIGGEVMKVLVIVPTYNERQNISQIIPEILDQDPRVEVLVVDDNSPDGTAHYVQEQAKTKQRLHLLLREKKQGLGRAYLAGFAWGLERDFDVIFEMDADFSHRPMDLKRLITEIESPDVDFVIGSRWVEGGGTVNWGVVRKLISKGGSAYSGMVLGYPVKDWTGGFNGWKRKVLEGLDLESVQSEGYSFQIELKYRASKKGFKGLEVPITFEERRVGQSKMSTRIVLEALYRVWAIK